VRPEREPGGSLTEAIQERLIGVTLIVGGVVGFGAVVLLSRYLPANAVAPSGMPRDLLPLLSPITCLVPISAIGACMLVLIGLRKLIFGS
jgi:hypothetical protein